VTVYLCGGINGMSDDRCRTWREYAKERLRCETLDPMRRDYRGIEDQNVAAIVEGDKADIDACDVVLVNALRPSWGTAMEVLYAWEHGKPCYCVASDPVSPWLRHHSVMISDDINTLIRAINDSAGIPC
jgi:nucleoside 2-deoxyribosyltransferase